jgi:Flp pilus assembly protein TadD
MRIAFLLLLATRATSAQAQSIQLAEMAADRCMFAQALDFLSKSPEAVRSSREARLLKARLLTQLGRGTEAVSALQSVPVSTKREEEADRLLALGLALSAAHRLNEAESAFRRARDAGADAEVVDEGTAALQIELGKLDEAEVLLKSVLRRAPLLSGALYNLAVIRVRRGDLAEAAALIRQAWHAGLRNPDELKRDPDLEGLRRTRGLIDDLLSASQPRCRTY